MNNSSSWMEV
jgi:hypothetical protein